MKFISRSNTIHSKIPTETFEKIRPITETLEKERNMELVKPIKMKISEK